MACHHVAWKNRLHYCAAYADRANFASEGEDGAAGIGLIGVTKAAARFDAANHASPWG